MKNSKLHKSIAIIAISIVLGVLSCDMFSPGLGDELDITSPVLDVSQANESYVSGDVVLNGVYEDDGVISSIAVTINSVAADLNVSINESTNTWSVTIPTENYSDGSYEVAFKITDSSGKSTTQKLVLYFDNHPPVVLIKEPLSFSDILNGDITIKGEVADKFRIDSVEVLLFDGDGNEYPWNEGGVSEDEENRKLLEDMTNSWSFVFDSKSYTETTGTYRFQVIATDYAGNSNTYFYEYSELLSANSDNSFSVDELELLEREGNAGDLSLTGSIIEALREEQILMDIDQDYDLPYYEFDTPSEDSMTLTDSLQAFGRVLDDDGVSISTIEISLDGGSWTAVDEAPDSDSTVASWSHDLSALGEGQYTLQIRSEDIYGKASESEELVFVIDSSGPSIAIDSPESGSYKNSAFSVSGTATDNIGVHYIQMSVDGGDYEAVVTWDIADPIPDEYSWTAPVPLLDDGSHTINFRAVDFSNRYYTQSFLVNIDTADPVVTYLSPQDSDTVNGWIQIHGSTSNQSSISQMVLTVSDGTLSNSYTLDDDVNEFDKNDDLDSILTGSTPSGSDSTRYFWYKNIDTTLYADNQPLIVSVDVLDIAGNSVTSSLSVDMDQDTDLPVFYFDNLDTGAGVTAMDNSFSGSPSLIGRIQDDDGVETSSIEVEVDESGTWVTPTISGSGLSVSWEYPIYSLSQGAHTFRIRAHDIYSDTLTVTDLIPYIYDTGAPTISLNEITWGSSSLTSGFQGTYVNSNPTIYGTASDGIAVASVDVNINGETSGGDDVYYNIYTTDADLHETVDWDYELDMASLSEGTVNLKFRTEDSTGKISYSDLTLIKDTTAPEIEFTDLYGSTLRTSGLNGLIQIKGVASDENQVERVEYALLSDDGSVTVTDVSVWTELDQTYSWSFWVDTTLENDGDYVVYARALDSSGNTSSDEDIEANRYEFTLDQDSDLPDFTFSNLDTGAADNLMGLEKTTLTGKVSDDDGLSKASIEIHFNNGTSLYDDTVTITETSDGLTEYTWSYDLPENATLPQSADPYEITLTATDVGETGGEFTKAAVSSESDAVSVYLDRTAPVLTETAVGSSDNLIISTEQSLTGEASDENELTSLTLSINGEAAENITVTGGTWSRVFNQSGDGLADGQYALVFTAEDAAGRETTLTRNLYIDATAPTITLTSAVSSYVDESISVSGTAADPGALASGVSKVQYSLDQVAGENAGAVWYDLNGTTAWSGTIDTSALAEEDWTLRFRAVDGGGRYSDQIIQTISADHESPRAEMVAGGTFITVDSEAYTATEFTLSGTADDDAWNTADADVRGASSVVLSYTLNGGSETSVALTPSDGLWSSTFLPAVEDDPETTDIDETVDGLSDGYYVFTLTVTDEAGKITTDQEILNLDTTEPTLSVYTPASGEAVDSGTYEISGTAKDTGGVGFDAADDMEYQLDDGSWVTLTLDGIEWSDTIDLSSEEEGAKVLHFRSTDAVGNQVTSDIQFYYDLNAPVLTETGISSTDTFYLNDDFQLEGTWTESNELDSIIIEYEKDGGSAVILDTLGPADFSGTDSGTDIAWSCLIPVDSDVNTVVLADGSYEFTITMTDGADRTAVITRNILIDTAVPSIDTYTNIDSVWTSDLNISFSGTATDDTGSGVASVEYCLVEEGDYSYVVDAYQIDNDADADENWSLFTNTTSSGTTSFSSNIRVNTGTALLLLRCTDKAGNVFTQDESDWQLLMVDNLIPSASISSPDAGALINADSDVSVTVSYSDDDSGVKQVELSLDNFTTSLDSVSDGDTDSEGDPITFAAPSGSQDLTLPQTTLAALSDGSHTLYVRSVDDAGNTSSVSTQTFILDTDIPEGVFTSHEADSVINKSVDFTGTATDDRSLNPIGSLEIENSSGDWIDITSDVTISGIYNWTISGFDSTLYDSAAYDSDSGTDGIQNSLRLELTDAAGNTGYAAITLTADQDTDRPVVKVNNLTLNAMASDSYIWLKQANVIYGTVTDDDGVGTLEVSTDDGSTWKDVTVSSGSWTHEVTDDGAYTMLFRVTDSEGTVFTASETDTYSLDTPKLTDNASTPNTYGYSDSFSAATALYITVDTQNPDVTSAEYYVDVDTWSTAVSSTTFGGTVDSVILRQFSYDANSIDTVEITLEENVSDDAGAVYSYTAAAGSDTDTINGNLYRAYEAEIDISALATGTRSLSITVTDMAGLTTKSTLSLIIDNTAPTVSLDSHDNNDQVSGSVTLKGSSSGSAEELLYKVTGSAAVPADWTVPVDGSGDPDYTTYGAHEVQSALSSWRINFDDDINNYDGFTHDRTLKRYIVALNSSLELDDTGSVVYISDGTKYTDITTLYFHFKVTDEYGNSDDSIYYTLKVDPQGDIPIVTMTYPSVSSHGWYNGTEGMVYTADENPSSGDSVYSDISMNASLGTLSSYDSSARTISYGGSVYSSMGGYVIQGGILRIQGSAEDDKSISGIYLQIDPSYDPAEGFIWDNSSEAAAGAELLPDGTSLSTLFSGEIIKFFGEDGVTAASDQWGIQIGDSISWSYTLNSDGEFNGTGGENNQIALRIYAIDVDGNISSVDTGSDCIVTIDSAAPRIGSSEPLYLYQYENNSAGTGEVTASKEYSDGMWLKGEWWLEGSVEDESGISSITMTNCSDFQTTAVADDGTWTGTSGYRIKALVGSSADTFGTLSYTLTAVDNDSGSQRTTDKDISLNFDNKAPELTADTDGAFDIDPRVVQSNGFYTLGSEVNETSSASASQSGFARVAFYFLRRGTTTKAVYDTWYLKDDAENKLAYESLTYDSGLYWMTETGITREDNLMVLTLASDNPNVHPGGLVKIGGSLYTITSVSGTTVIIDGSPAITETTAYFAVAQVVDHQLTESNGSTLGTNGYYSDVVNDDNDSMVESVSVQGGTAAWEANINSRNIPDGPIEIHYVAFDEAGNYSIGVMANVVQGSYTGDDASEVAVYTYDTDTRVANNAPRLAAVWYGSDDDGSGTVETDELTGDLFGVDYTSSYTPGDTGIEYDANLLTDSYTMGSAGDPLMTIKGNISIIPEIVGGNGDLFYEYSVTRSGETAPYYAVNVDAGSVWASGTDYSGSGDNSEILDTASLELTLEDFLSAGDTGSEIEDGEDQTFSFTFWDSTEESDVGVDSQSASLSMVMDVALRDTTAPVVSIDPFFWNSESDSSTTGLEGHIELAGSGGRTTPAVSGTVEMSGTVTDNQLVNALYLTIPGWNGDASILAASYNSSDSSFTTNASLPAGVTFAAETITLDNSEHEVSWSMIWDTSSIDATAVTDLDVTVSAEDRGVPVLSGTISYTPNSAGTSTTMDVVPYIVKVETGLASLKSNNWSVYNRTARGHYPVKDDEIISVYGYNLTGAAGVTVTNDGTYDVATVNVGTYGSSGELTLTVNGVSTLNNSNDNTEEYNQLPNGDNNELLTDDVVLDIWEMDSEAIQPISGMIEQPVMKINPNNGMIGFAFVNGPLYFSMGNDTRSAQYWMGSYDFFTSVGFLYDKLGYSYGVAAGGDINSTSADKFQLMTSRWGIARTEQNGSYTSQNSLRLESIGQYISGIINFNKQRIKSPSLASAVHGTATNLYLAYYDDINQEIRFKYGSTTSTNETNFGSFTDYDTRGEPYNYRNGTVSMIAGSNTGNIAGEYVSIAVVSDEVAGDVDDVVVAVWYDSTNRCLWYTYNDTPTTDRDGDTDGTGWSTPIRVFDAASDLANAGEYCQIIADRDGGIHIAAYDPMNLDLVYAHFNSYTDASAETAVVDGYGVVGSNITLDVAKSAAGDWTPYIGYYATSCIRPKYAYKVDTTSDAPTGSADEAYTGAWEITVLPTNSTLSMGSLGNNKINIGVWKDADTWVQEASLTGTDASAHSGSSYGATCWDTIYANGTENPILGYAVKSGSNGFVETAQMK